MFKKYIKWWRKKTFWRCNMINQPNKCDKILIDVDPNIQYIYEKNIYDTYDECQKQCYDNQNSKVNIIDVIPIEFKNNIKKCEDYINFKTNYELLNSIAYDFAYDINNNIQCD